MTASTLQRIQQIRQQLPPQVRLIAVTKTVSPELMRVAYQAGIRDFGENRLQEAISKQEQLQDLTDVTWHFIGHLQSNKAKKALEHFQWVHSVDSLQLAQRLNRLATELSLNPNICLQIKVLPDPNKYGWEIPDLMTDFPQILQCHQLNLQGLMTILPFGLPAETALNGFKSLNNLSKSLESAYKIKLSHLSMGMSGDYPLAIQAGATLIRLGTILFGERKKDALL